jgi:hypothetical protein
MALSSYQLSKSSVDYPQGWWIRMMKVLARIVDRNSWYDNDASVTYYLFDVDLVDPQDGVLKRVRVGCTQREYAGYPSGAQIWVTRKRYIPFIPYFTYWSVAR